MDASYGPSYLPKDLFLVIVNLLPPTNVVRCRRVCSRWYRAFTDPLLLRDSLILHYPNCEEVRRLVSPINRDLTDSILKDCGKKTGACSEEPESSCSQRVYDKVVARYSALQSGKPWLVRRLDLCSGKSNANHDLTSCSRHKHLSVPRWKRYLHLPRPRRGLTLRADGVRYPEIPIDSFETAWTCDAGRLIYADPLVGNYVLLDLKSNTTASVPFLLTDRITRRIRLNQNTLIIEWAEKEPYHQLNDSEKVHRHFVTAFDVIAVHDFPWLPPWEVKVRSEWKLHYLGFPLSSSDLWLSTHTDSYYAIYIWQHNRSAWGQEEPIESFFVWDITQSSRYRPSEDPSGTSQQVAGPCTVRKLSFLNLDYLTLRQRDAPSLRRLELDDSMVYFFMEGNSREKGFHVGDNILDRRFGSWERVVGLPIQGHGPHWEDTYGHTGAASRSKHPKRATCWREMDKSPGINNQVHSDGLAGIVTMVEQFDADLGSVMISIHGPDESWQSKLDLGGIKWTWCEMYADERFFIIQSTGKEGDELRILHFDKPMASQGLIGLVK